MDNEKYSEFKNLYDEKVVLMWQKHITDFAWCDRELVFGSFEYALLRRILNNEKHIKQYKEYAEEDVCCSQINVGGNCFSGLTNNLKINLIGRDMRGKPKGALDKTINFKDEHTSCYGTLTLKIPQEKIDNFDVYKKDFDEEILNDFSYYDMMAFMALAPRELILAEKETMAEAIDKQVKASWDEVLAGDNPFFSSYKLMESGEKYVELKSCLCALVDRFRFDKTAENNDTQNHEFIDSFGESFKLSKIISHDINRSLAGLGEIVKNDEADMQEAENMQDDEGLEQ